MRGQFFVLEDGALKLLGSPEVSVSKKDTFLLDILFYNLQNCSILHQIHQMTILEQCLCVFPNLLGCVVR